MLHNGQSYKSSINTFRYNIMLSVKDWNVDTNQDVLQASEGSTHHFSYNF